MKKILLLIGLSFVTIGLTHAALAAGDDWQPLPPAIKEEVEEFFTTLELGLNNHRLEIVMSLYTADATEELPAAQGGKQGVAAIRQRRLAEMEHYARTATQAPSVPIDELLYQPGAGTDAFRIKYVVRGAAASALLNAKAGEIVYNFRRSKRGLELATTQLKPLLAMAAAKAAPRKAAPPLPARPPLDPNGPPPTTLMLSNGAVLQQVVVLNWQPDAVLIQHRGGTVPIRLEYMAPPERAYFTANMQEALRRQNEALLNAARASAANEQMRANSEQQNAEESARAADESAQQEAACEDAVSHRRLIIGMTKEQVRRSWGSPSRTTTFDHGGGETGVLWFFDGRGIDEHGVPANAGVGFFQEKVLVLYNVKNR